MRLFILLIILFISACNQKKIRIIKTSKEEGRRSVNLFYDVYPDSIKVGNIKYPTSEYYQVYSVYFPLEDHEHFKKINSDEFEEYFPDISLYYVEKKFQELNKIDSNFSGFRIYHGFDSTSNDIKSRSHLKDVNSIDNKRLFKSENFLVYVKSDPANKKLIKEDTSQVYRVENHIFDLRGFTEIRTKFETKNYHLSCAPNCPKPDLISDN